MASTAIQIIVVLSARCQVLGAGACAACLVLRAWCWHPARPCLFLVDGHGLTSSIVPAIGADAVRLLGLMTMRALAEADRLERVVRPALRRARLGVSSFRIWHRSVSSSTQRMPSVVLC